MSGLDLHNTTDPSRKRDDLLNAVLSTGFVHVFFYKKQVYKKHEPQIWEKFKKLLRNSPGSDLKFF